MLLVALVNDALALRNLARLATVMEMDLVQVASLGQVEGTVAPTAVAIDLESEHGPDLVRDSKTRWPFAMVIGLVTMPGGDTWKRGEAAGCDFVTTRGAVGKAAPARLASWMERPGGRRLRLFALAEVAGRLGVVDRLDDPSVGPIAVYHIGGAICVAQDTCPHAGARLSHGEVDVDDGVVTCPEHGSRFDIKTGDRVRGPSDLGLRTFRVIVEEGQVYVQLEGG